MQEPKYWVNVIHAEYKDGSITDSFFETDSLWDLIKHVWQYRDCKLRIYKRY